MTTNAVRVDGRRIAAGAAGAAALAIVWLTPAAWRIPGPFSAHMTVHMTVVAVAAPLLAIALAGSRRDPVSRAPRLFAPVPAAIVELAVVWAWHAPSLHQFARHSAGGFVLEQAMFLAAGLLVWLACFGGNRDSSWPARQALGVVALLLTSMHMTLLGALLALGTRAVYSSSHPVAAGGLSPLDDQHLAGAIMLISGAVVYLAGGLWLAAGLLQRARTGRGAAAELDVRP